MKKFLSTVLALVMVLTTFAMLVPNAVAAGEPQQVEAKVLYEENFDDLNGKTPAEILAGANMKDERPEAGDLSEMYVANGSLRFARPALQDTFFVLKDKDVLKDGFVIEYDLEFLGSSKLDNGFTFITGEGKGYNSNQGRDGLVSQMRFNTNVLSSVNNAGSWATIKNATPTSLTNYQDTDSDGKIDMLNQRTSVKAVFDPDGYVVKTFAQAYKAELDEWNEATMASVSSTTATDYSALFGNDLRLMIYAGALAAMDNLKITTLDGQEIYSEDFNDIQATTNSGILEEIGWTSHQRHATETYVTCEGGRLVLGNSTGLTTAAQQELILVENSEDAKNGFVVEYDFEIPYGISAGEGFNIASAKGDFSKRNGRQGWTSQFRWNRHVLCGADNGVNWQNHVINNTKMADLTANGSNMQGTHLAVRAVFDRQGGYVATYAQKYTGAPLTWTEANLVQKSGDLSAYAEFMDGTVRLIVYATISLKIDNIKVTALEKTPNVYGYQKSTDSAANIRLLGVIDNDIFTNAEKVGFRVTMTKDGGETTKTRDIDCEYVYSSITQWGADTPTQAADMLFGASHIYALHVNGITEAVTITVTPYYVDEGVTYLGDAATIEYDPAA